jgi:phage baseplate assembly protein W
MLTGDPGRGTLEASRAFLGRGWRHPLRPDANGRLGWSAGETTVEQSLWLILSTARGERLMLPDFGCGIHELVFTPNVELSRGDILAEVTSALVRWEPRIDLLGVDVSAGQDEPNLLLIHIDYRIRAVNTVHNLVYPFFITEGGGR